MRAGSDIVVATPGRFIDILCMNRGRLVSLERVTYVVLDEADRMFDMGFLPDVHHIVSRIPKDRQTLLFSATMPPPIAKIAKRFLRDPVEIRTKTTETTVDSISQYFVPVSGEVKKLEALTRRTRGGGNG